MDIPSGATDAALFAIIVGFFQPIVLNLILQSGWSNRLQAVVAFLFSILTGALTAFFAGAFTGLGIITTILLVSVVSISSYKGFWQKITPELKSATSVDKGAVG